MLNNELAQRIVDSVMSIISYNVNIMDEDGYIIGSGNRERIGKFHKVAYDVILNNNKDNKYGVIYDEGNDSLNMKAGVNLPIFFNNRVIGAIGVTGNPQEVLVFGKLIQLTAQLIVSREYSATKIIFKKSMMEEFVNKLLSGIEINQILISELNSLGVEYNKAAYCMIIPLSKDYDFLTISRIQDEIITKYPKDIVSRYDNQIVIFSADKPSYDRLNNLFDQNIKLYIGSKVETWVDLYRSYKSVKLLSLINIEESVVDYEKYKLQSTILSMWAEDNNIFKDELSKFEKIIENSQLYETYEAFIKYNGSINEMCNNLYVHRNTIIYRLNKIKEITGFSLSSLDDQYQLFILYTISKIKKLKLAI